MPLPKFPVTGNLRDILPTPSGGEIATPVWAEAYVILASNIKDGVLVWDGGIYNRPPAVKATVDPTTGNIEIADGPIELLDNDPGLNVTGIQWRCDIKTSSANVIASFWFPAPGDGSTVDLGQVAHVPAVEAHPVPTPGVKPYANLAAFPTTGALNVLYVANDTNLLYRWSGSAYVGVGGSGGGSADEYHEYVNQAAFPGTGTTDRIYVALDTGKFYRWTGSAYNQIGGLPAAVADVTGLQAALDGKGSALAPTAVKTSAYTAAVSDLVPADATSAAFTVTLPTAPADKTRIAVKKIDTTTNAVTIAAGGSDVFNKTSGSTTLTLSLQNQGVVLQYKTSGAIWYVVSTDVPLSGLDARYSPTFTGYDVILVAGQSNADDYGIGIDAIYLDNPDPRIKQYARSGIYADQVVTAINPLLSKVPEPSDRIGFAMTFAKDYIDNRMAPGRKVLIVPAAVGGTSFTSTSLASPPAGYYTAQFGANGGSWDPAKGDGGVSLYQLAIDKANAAIATQSGSKIVAVLWLQGEGDSTMSGPAYQAKLDALIDGFRANITGASTVPFVVGQMVPDWVSFNTTLNAVHAATPTRKTRCAFATGASGMSNASEPYHYNAAGQRYMGHSMYTAFATI